MTQKPRFLPPGGALVEVTYRTVQGRYLLRPSRKVNETLVGVLARACERYPGVSLIGIVALSNHLHLLLRAESQYDLSKVMEYFGGQVARKINRLHGWDGPLWQRRYRAICVTEEPAAQIARLEYLLAQTIKENLVAKVKHWPGVHFAKELLEGRGSLVGKWSDDTRKYQASIQGKALNPDHFESIEILELCPLPCWSHLNWRQYVELVRAIVRRLERQAADARQRNKKGVLGAVAIRKRHPHDRSGNVKKAPAPLIHAASRRARQAFRDGLSWFLQEYRRAADLLKAGHRTVRFPEGCFPPRLPFVSTAGGLPLRPAGA